MRDLHDRKVTRNMLRLGSRSKDEVVSQYSLEALEQLQKKTSLHKETGHLFGQMKALEEVSYCIDSRRRC
jgi:hypothetical protein